MDNYIKTIEYQRIGVKTTVACITLYNGFEVIGQSSCVDPKQFNQALGEKYALEDARKNLEPYIGFYLSVMKDGYPYHTSYFEEGVGIAR